MGMQKLLDWIERETAGHKTVVDFGSGFFEKLKYTSCPNKIGIEAWQPFIDRAKYHDCKKICGDFLEFEKLLEKEEMDVAMFCDTLEHVTMEQAADLIKRLQSTFNKILLFIPEGNHPSEDDPHGLGADYYETHRSTWHEKDVRALGFSDVLVDPLFHSWVKTSVKYANNDTGAIYAVWERNERVAPMNPDDVIGD